MIVRGIGYNGGMDHEVFILEIEQILDEMQGLVGYDDWIIELYAPTLRGMRQWIKENRKVTDVHRSTLAHVRMTVERGLLGRGYDD